jgi:hypothetical protein
MCYNVAKKHLEHLEMTLPTSHIEKEEEEAHSDIVMVKVAVSGETSGLDSFSIKPDCLSGESLSRHMVQNRLLDPKVREHRPSLYLDIEFNSNQIG